MKYLVCSLLCTVLIGCKQPQLEKFHQQVKDEGIGSGTCYKVLLPPEIAGNYCVIYLGDALKDE